MSIRSRAKLSLAVVAVMLLVGTAIVSTTTLGLSDQSKQSIHWRLKIYASKLLGDIPELSWVELWQMTRVRRGFGLEEFVSTGVSIEGSVANPFDTTQDRQNGKSIFDSRCSSCHGHVGDGLRAPALNRAGLQRGDSDLAIYQVVRDGVPGTAMPKLGLTWLERWQVVAYVRTLQTGSELTGLAARHLQVSVSADELRIAGHRSDEWLTYSGSLSGIRFSRSNELTPEKVSKPQLRWVRQFDRARGHIEATPIVAGGAIFMTLPPGDVVALDATSGIEIWRYRRNIPKNVSVCCGRVNRGLAILDHVLYFGSLDGYLIAIDANSGKELWRTKVADSSKNYALTGAPLVANTSIVVGVSGGDFGIRGFLAAYDASSGNEQWRFLTIPGPGEPGHETWENDAWKTGGGGTWTTGSFDESLGLIYWGVGNPAPDYLGDARPGDNLYTNSVVALNAKTGKLAWHFQFTPHDEYDYDSAQTPILTELTIDRKLRKVICWANRNGFYYVLDRATGEFLIGTPFVEVNWTSGLDPEGRPLPLAEPGGRSTGRLIRPSGAGAANWQNSAFDPTKKLIFIPALEGASVYTKNADTRRGSDQGMYLGSSASISQKMTLTVRALDATTGEKVWDSIAPPSTEYSLAFSGLLATSAGTVFGASRGAIFALDSTNGSEIWRIPLGGPTTAPPISFAVDGEQVIGVAAGNSFFVFGF